MKAPAGWITEEQFFGELHAKGVDDISTRQLERWRYKGVFPRVLQDPLIYGSVTYYPPGSCEQAIAVRDLLRKKRKFEYVGWELWWRGFWADEKHWKPRLDRTVATLDRGLRLIRKFIAADNNSDLPTTVFDRIAMLRPSNFLLSRINRRAGTEGLATVYRVVLTTAAGQFNGYEPVTKTLYQDSEHFDEMSCCSYDEMQIIAATDFGQSESDEVLGQKLNFIGSLVPILRDLSCLFGGKSLADLLKQDSQEIYRAARDDARNALRLGLSLYEVTEWIYGPKSFGLRSIAWLAKKYDRTTAAVLIIGLAGLRKISCDLLPSDEIARLAAEAEKVLQQSRQLKSLYENDQRFAQALHPKRLRRGFRDAVSSKALLTEIQTARMT